MRKTTNGVWIQVNLTTCDTFSLWPLCTSLLVQVCAWLWRCRCYRWSHHSFSCHPSECHSCRWWSQDEELNHVGLSVHVEYKDDEKYIFQLKLNHSKSCWTAGSNVILSCPEMHWNLMYSFALSSLEANKEHLLMIYDLVVDTVVLLVYWNRRHSCRLCFHIVVAVGKGASWLMSILEMWLRYLTQSSVQPCTNWDARHTALFWHWSSIEVYLPRFSAPLFASISWWSCCHGLWPHFFPWNDYWGTVEGVLNAANAVLIRSIVLWLGRSHTSHWHMFTPSSTCLRQEGHWVVAEVCLSSINSMLPIS